MGTRTATVVVVNRNSCLHPLKKHRVDHSELLGSDAVWQKLEAAALQSSNVSKDASAECDLLSPQHHLWAHVDKQVMHKSAAVKATVQALCLRKLTYTNAALSTWMEWATVVATGVNALYADAMVGWDCGLDASGRVDVEDSETTVDTWSPFELYDRTEDARFENCLGDSRVQRIRSRVKIGRSCKAAWEAAVDAHWKMLTIEAESDVFAVSETLNAAQIGGLFLLSHTADNWPKRFDIFDSDFWLLRVVHLGIERNTPLQILKFDLGALNQTQPPALVMDSRKVYCWLANSLVALVALKVAIFFKIRTHAYDLAAGRALTSEHQFGNTIKVDRHDLEQSKSHWRPETTPVPMPILTPVPAPAATPAFVEALVPSEPSRKRECPEPRVVFADAASLVPVREVLDRLAAERAALRKRVEYLDEAVCTHLAFSRLCDAQIEHQHASALARLDELFMESQSINRSPNADCSKCEDEMRRISAQFTPASAHRCALDAVRKEVATVGLLLRVEDRVWGTDRHSVRMLVAVGADANTQSVRRHVRQSSEFERLFGSDGKRGELGTGAALVAKCGAGGHLRAEAHSLVDRLLALMRVETEMREVKSLDTKVRLPLELAHPLALAGVLGRDLAPKAPAHIKAYAAAVKTHGELRGKADAFVATSKRTMGHAILTGFNACMDEILQGERVAVWTDFPLRLKQQVQRLQCARDVVHAMLGIAHAFGGLADDDGSMGVDEPVPIIAWNRDTQCLVMPFPERVVLEHWRAAQHLVTVVSRAEEWIRNPRKHRTRELDDATTWVTLGPNGPIIHAENKERFMQKLDDELGALDRCFWPNWPPKSSQISTLPRIVTALTWGKRTACQFLSLEQGTNLQFPCKTPYASFRRE